MWVADHPRACGANRRTAARNLARVGSSPRMRGKPARARRSTRSRRIIPAHAGQTTRACSPVPVNTDHPRACGANGLDPNGACCAVGSSPRMRGKLGLCGLVRRCSRIIPAHAGQTPDSRSTSTRSSDHPRACGANWHAHQSRQFAGGSSPRMRGKQRPVAELGWRGRIIPAHAGQTCTEAACEDRCSDHPRACGANKYFPRHDPNLDGSSPRMRGKLARSPITAVRRRIIPAHAGQTSMKYSWPFPVTDHPRACGANLPPSTASVTLCGSSPRMRGKQLTGEVFTFLVRIIPAHAGQTENMLCS